MGCLPCGGDAFRALTDGDQTQSLRGGECADACVRGDGMDAKLTHSSENDDALCTFRNLHFRKRLNGRLHGFWVRVVGIVEKGDAFPFNPAHAPRRQFHRG